ncbi:hypothetical protein M0812_25207 [Anaeramoeba flamelloides]|uniref:B box-type domain-containing protein n=1 Tax=Anaeramoeba flamelloides TaxID=1746091 RepID=A0AAV7YCP9_9EUKA|nr:hypothetical protein M0812_25207 [Anaeramoeba flamelloides]
MNKSRSSQKKKKTKKRLKAKHEKPKKRKKKKKKKSQGPKTLRDIRIPVEPQIPQCEVCEEKKADFYCTECKVHYCQNCESEVHTSFFEEKSIKNSFSKNLIFHKRKSIPIYATNTIKNYSYIAEIQSNETIQKSLELKNKFKIEIKKLSNFIENQSDLLIQKIQKSKINHLNLLLKVEIISNTKFTKIINKNEAKQEEVNETKSQIKILTKLEKNKKTIKLIQESKGMIEKEEREKERKREQQRKRVIQREKEEESEEIRRLNQREIQRSEEEFDPVMNRENLIKLKNENKTAWNQKYDRNGIICGKKIYSRGKHQIKIKIDQFPNPKNEWNLIYLGIIKTENRENFIKKRNWEGIYYFSSYWYGRKKIESEKVKKENGKRIEKNYPEKIYLKKNDIFTIFLDMDQKKISFKLNEKELEGWENLPEKVNFFAFLRSQKGKEKNQITII